MLIGIEIPNGVIMLSLANQRLTTTDCFIGMKRKNSHERIYHPFDQQGKVK